MSGKITRGRNQDPAANELFLDNLRALLQQKQSRQLGVQWTPQGTQLSITAQTKTTRHVTSQLQQSNFQAFHKKMVRLGFEFKKQRSEKQRNKTFLYRHKDFSKSKSNISTTDRAVISAPPARSTTSPEKGIESKEANGQRRNVRTRRKLHWPELKFSESINPLEIQVVFPKNSGDADAATSIMVSSRANEGSEACSQQSGQFHKKKQTNVKSCETVAKPTKATVKHDPASTPLFTTDQSQDDQLLDYHCSMEFAGSQNSLLSLTDLSDSELIAQINTYYG